MGAQLKALLAGGRVLRVFALGHLFSPKLVEMIGWRGGFDAVWFDQEHAGLSMAQIEEGSRAARGAGLNCFVRLNATDYATVMRALEAGAGGVMASMVKNARQAEEIVSWAKFHPRGCRGVNGTGVDGRYGSTPGAEYFRRANAETVVAVQIEHADAVEDVRAHRRRAGPGFPLYRAGRPEPVDGDSGRVGASADVGGRGADGAGGGGEPRGLGDPAARRRPRPPLRRAGLPDAVGRHGRLGVSEGDRRRSGRFRRVFWRTAGVIRSPSRRNCSPPDRGRRL